MKKILSIIVLAILLLPTKVMAEENADKIHFIYVGGSNAFLLESNGEYMLIDSGNPSDETAKALFNEHKYSEGWTFTSRGIDGNGVVNYIQNTLGVTHLDYVMASHAHWDHNGGMWDIAMSSLVDENTQYIHKNYECQVTDVNRTWFNDWFADRAIKAFTDKGAAIIETTGLKKNASNYGMTYTNKSNKLSNNVSFKLGNYTIRLYNLENLSNTSENVNSIVVYVDNGKHDALIMNDMQISGGGLKYGYKSWANLEKDLVNQIYPDTGAVDVIQLGHHGANTSNGSDLITKVLPKIYILSKSHNSVGINMSSITAFSKKTGGKIFNTFDTKSAVVVDMSQDQIQAYNGNTTNLMKEAVLKNLKQNGWLTWSYNGGKTDDYYNKWMYVKNGNLQLGWQKISGKWYYFYKLTGIMKTGWLESNKKWYYLNASGAMDTGWKKVSGKWYYMDKTSGEMLTGWLKDGNKWYYLDKQNGDMQVNKWVGNYYVQSDGTMAVNKWIGNYHVNANGKWDKTK